MYGYTGTMLHYTEEWACSQFAGKTSTVLSVTVVIEALNESDASVSMVIFLDCTTTEASSLPPPPHLFPVCTLFW